MRDDTREGLTDDLEMIDWGKKSQHGWYPLQEQLHAMLGEIRSIDYYL